MYFWELWPVIPSKLKFRDKKGYLQPASVLHDDSRSDHDDPAVPGSENFPLVGGNNIFGQGGQGLINHYAAIILPGAVEPMQFSL